MKSLIFILLILFSQLSFSQEGDVTKTLTSGCGMSKTNVIPADGTICEEDIAFGMLYEMFPSLFNELLPMWGLDYVQTADGELTRDTYIGLYNGDKIFFTLFEMFFKLVAFCIVIYVVILGVSTATRLLKGEDLSDNQGGSKDNPKSWLMGAVLGGSFLIPVKNFFLGQAIVFTLGVSAISGANFVMSIFLAGNQTMFNQNSNPTRIAETSVSGTKDRHYYIADSFYRYLTRMQLCREQSAKWILASDGINVNTPEEYVNLYKCSSGSTSEPNSPYKAKSDDDYSGFAWFQGSEYKFDPINPFTTIYNKEFSGINFETRRFEGNSCKDENLNVGVIKFSCGSMQMQTIDWSGNGLFQLLSYNEIVSFFYEIDTISQVYSSEMDQQSVENMVYQKWTKAREILETALVNAWERDASSNEFTALDGKVIDEATALKQIIIDKNNRVFVDAAQKFHTHAMNSITFGGHRSLTRLNYTPNPALTTGNMGSNSGALSDINSVSTTSAFTHHFAKSAGFAKQVESAQCMDQSWDHESALLIMRFLKGESVRIDGLANPRCLDVLNAAVIEHNPTWVDLPAKELMLTARKRFNNIEKELIDNWVSTIEVFADQRRGVESSFNRVIKNDLPMAAWGRMRSQGYLAIADYAQTMSNVVVEYKRDLKMINNNFSFGDLGFETRFISWGILAENTEQIGKFPPFESGNEAFVSTDKTDGSMDEFVGSYHWIAAQEALIRSPNTITTDDINIGDVFKMISSPSTFWNRLGLDMSREGRTIEKCMDDPTMCPFPQTDPVVELSLIGHDMLDLVAKVYTVAAAGSALNQYAKISTAQGTGIKGGIKDALNAGKTKNITELISKGGQVVFGLLDVVYKILGFIMVTFAILGLLLAYLLPFLPKIYLYMGFISWLMVLVMASFSVLLWSVYWIRFTEKRDVITRAGYHYGVELMFKPTFNLIAVLFAWYFFYVVAFIIGMTIQWVWTLPLSGDSSLLRGYTDIIFVVIVIGMVYYVGLKYAYQLMDDLSGEMLEKLGVKNKKAKDGVSELIKAILYDKARSGLENVHGRTKMTGGAREANMDKLDKSNRVLNDFYKEHDRLKKQKSSPTANKGEQP